MQAPAEATNAGARHPLLGLLLRDTVQHASDAISSLASAGATGVL